MECIERATPVITRRHPAVIQYLRPDYLLYYDHEADLPDILSDSSFLDKVINAHEFLIGQREHKVLCVDKFSTRLNQFIESI